MRRMRDSSPSTARNRFDAHPTGGAFAVVLLIIAVPLTGCGRDETADTAAAASTSTARIFDRAPAEIRWESYQDITLPIGGVDGPHQTSGRSVTGFTPTPQGAALAAINHSARLSGTVGVATDAPRILGYSVWTYQSTPRPAARAEIAVYSRRPDGAIARNDVTVLWTDHDWRLPEGVNTTPVTFVDDRDATFVRLEAP